MSWRSNLIISAGVGVVVNFIYSVFVPYLISVPEQYYQSYRGWTFFMGFSTVAYFFVLSIYFLKKREKGEESRIHYILAVIFALIAVFGFPALIILYEKIEGVILSDLEFMAMGGVLMVSLLPIAIVSTHYSFRLAAENSLNN